MKYGNYEVYDTGVIVSYITGKELRQCSHGDHYLYVDLFNPSKTRTFVHRLVAQLFIPNPSGKKIVNHIDGDKHNNHFTNLEWVTSKENSIHAVTLGLSPKGENKTLSKLTEVTVLEIQALFKEGYGDNELSRIYNVTSGVISSIRLGKTWKHVSGVVFDKMGRQPPTNRKLTAEDIPVVRELLLTKNDADIGRLYGVARGTINQIRQGKTWKNY
jgi:hypothetical protein